MWKINALVAWRNIRRHKAFTLINILGLSLGMAACLLLLQFVVFEWSFDRFHEKSDQIYRVVNERLKEGKRVQIGAITYPRVGHALKENYPEVIDHTRMIWASRGIIRNEDQIVAVEESLWTDEHFFEIFSFPVLVGDPALLKEKYKLIFTVSEAERVFGVSRDQISSLIGKRIELDRDGSPYEIIAVMEDPPANSQFQFNMVGSFPTLSVEWGPEVETSWTWSDFYHYVELEPGTSLTAFNEKMPAFSQQYFKGTEVTGSEERFWLQPLTDIRLKSPGFEYEIVETGNYTIVMSMLVIALLIILIAWINYINLATVRAFERAKEVGVRKVLGASKSELIRQFLLEALGLNLLSLMVALVLVEVSMPFFQDLMGIEGNLKGLLGAYEGLSFVPYLLVGLLLAGILLSGIYPAFVLSTYRTINVIKGKFSSTKQGASLRKVLVTFQFTASLGFIAATIIAYQQVQFALNKDLGISIDKKLIIRGPELTEFDSTYIDKMDIFRQKAQQYPQVEQVASSFRIPSQRLGRTFSVRRLGEDEKNGYTMSNMGIDHAFFETYEIDLVAGRYFKPTDHNLAYNKIDKVVLNESAIETLGFEDPAAAIGQKIKFWRDQPWEIVGVVNDFHQESLRSPIESMFFVPLYNPGGYLSIKVDDEKIDQTIAQLQSVYQGMFPNNAFDYFFLADEYQSQYSADSNFGKILGFFSIIALGIACLGLFGLISFAAILRSKELGIRKILGASVNHLMMLLTKDFALLLLIALVLAVPITSYGINQWLSGFAYHIHIQWWVFLLAGLAVAIIGAAAVGYRSFRAATLNPVDTLRQE